MARNAEKSFSKAQKFAAESPLLERLIAETNLSEAQRSRISSRAATYVTRIREEADSGLMEEILGQYSLSTQEGVALMCLAEAMLRVPDVETVETLIEDKIVPSDWGRHLGQASSTLVNASTWALLLTGKVLDDTAPGVSGVLRGLVKRLGEPVIRVAVERAMRVMGQQFVLAETIDGALDRAMTQEDKGYTYSYDMLGEAAMTAADAARYAGDYANAIAAIARASDKGSVEANPGISIKLSALFPRYEVAQADRVMEELVPVVRTLARSARAAGMGLNIDAEEQNRLVLSLDIIEMVLSDPELAGWDGFGVVVQAYGKRAGAVIDWLYALATRLDRRIMVRLVKGAYWDTEMKLAQVEGHPDFPLFTSKTGTDVSYVANAKRLFGYTDRIFPQFATHNAHSIAAILELADGRPFEFQRLHGMGEALHNMVREETGHRCRIYAPVGRHENLLAYLVRRLLENGANSSFVNQITDETVPAEEIAADPFAAAMEARSPSGLVAPSDLFAPTRRNSMGFDLTDRETLDEIATARLAGLFDPGQVFGSIVVGYAAGQIVDVENPANGAVIATVLEAGAEAVDTAISDARTWDAPVAERAEALLRAADLYEASFGQLFAVLTAEAGKTLPDAVGELREAVDFLRYYANEALAAGDAPKPRGIIAAISPWNFPLAIFTGQISAALAAGNAVLAKPAEATPVIASLAVGLLHQAGVPKSALQLLLGQGGVVGQALTANPRIAGVVFTGSTATAKRIRSTMAAHLAPGAPLIAETGGLNAMIVDSTALPEQVVRDVVTSAFQSAGQRCSALRCLYVQEDIAEDLIEMLKGAMDALRLGDPAALSTDVGPVISEAARAEIAAYIAAAEAHGKVLHQVPLPDTGAGHFVPPVLISVAGMGEMAREIFGPVLHVATFAAKDLDRVIAEINDSGYGLTFGLHTRVDSRVQYVADRITAGNLYINRNQIGAIVGSQPFGGEGLSGTGPKAGGPHYLTRFQAPKERGATTPWAENCDIAALEAAIASVPLALAGPSDELPGPTGEANTLSLHPRGPVLCLGPGPDAADTQAQQVAALGGAAVKATGRLDPTALSTLAGIEAVIYWGDDGRDYAKALASRTGPILPLITEAPDSAHVMLERHLCVDTTASGGNAALMAG